MWVVVSCAIFGNLCVLIVTFFSRQTMTVQKLLMCNLAFSDFVLGVYLFLLAITDASTLGEYFIYAIPWQYHGGCQAAGFLAIFATTLSVLTLVVITLERWYAIRHAINLSKRLRSGLASIIMACIWLYALLIATLPIIGISSYSQTSICLPMRADSVVDKLYLFFVLVTNAMAFIVICMCYVDMYIQVCGNKTNPIGSNDANIAKKMAILVFTDFACLFPIVLFGLTAASGWPLINVSQSKILLVFFYPLNACCNPFLYVIITKQFRKDLRGILSRCGCCQQRIARSRVKDSSIPAHSASNSRANSAQASAAFKKNKHSKVTSQVSRKSTSHRQESRESDGTSQTYLSSSGARLSMPGGQLEACKLLVTEEPINVHAIDTGDGESQNSKVMYAQTFVYN